MNRKLSSFDIYLIVLDLQELKNSFIEKIYQLSRNELLIRIKDIKLKQKESLYIKNGEFICNTHHKFEPPLKPTTFAMTLRKYLINSKITNITQHEFDRIIKIELSKGEKKYSLIIEFFSDGNIILLDSDDKIILPLIKQFWSHRTIKPGIKYCSPPSQKNPFKISKNEFFNVIKKSNADLVRTLAVNVNLGGTYAEEICKRSKILKNTETKKLTEKEVEKNFLEFLNLLEIFKKNKFQPVLVKKNGKTIDILPFKFKSYVNVDFEYIDNFTRNLTEFIFVEKKEKRELSNIEKKLRKLERQLIQQEAAAKEHDKKSKKKKIEADLIYFNFKQCENLLNEIKNIFDFKDKKEKIEKINERLIVKKFDPQSNMLIVNLPDNNGIISEVQLDYRKTVSENADKLYKESKKYRAKQIGAKESIANTKKLIKSYKNKEKEEKKKEIEYIPSRIFWFENFHWFVSSDDNIVVAGKDAKSNDKVVKKYLKSGDRYAHADIQGAPSCIIKNKNFNNENIIISKQTLEEACIFSACYSKAWKHFTEVQAYWTLPEQVSKTPQSGEFVPKGSFIIRGKRNYFRCKLEFSVGEIKLGNTKKIMGGPIEAVKKRSSKYIVIIPGEIKKNIIANKLAQIFNTSIDQINRILPPGGVTVVNTIGFEFDKNEM